VATKAPLAKPVVATKEVVVQRQSPDSTGSSPASPPSLSPLRSPLHLTVGPGRYDLAARQVLGVYTSGLHKGGPIEQRPNTARLRTASKAAPGIAGDITDPGFPPIQLKAMEPETRQG